jgi:site-specific DNA recombinase
MTETASRVAVLYAAKSTEDTHGSIPDQLADGRKLAAARGLDVVAEHQDEAKSAYHGDRGPGLANAMALCERLADEHGACALVVQHSDRLARGDAKQARHLIEIVLWAIKRDVQLLSVQDPEMLAGGDMALLLGAIGGMRNHQDSKRKSLSVQDGARRRAQRGEHHGSKAPFGYRWHEKRLVPVPAQAAVIRRIFELYTSGVGQRGIVRTLNDEGVPTRSGGPWRQSAISRILNSLTVVGQLTYKGELIPGAKHEAIVDQDVWDRAKAIRTSASRDHPGRQPESAHLLTHGLLRCACCGSAMVPRKARPGEHERYVCGGRIANPASCSQPSIRRELIDEPFLRHLIDGHLDLEATRQRITTHITGAHGAALEQVGHADSELRRVERALVVTEQAFDAGDIDARQYGKREARLTDEIEGARNALEQAQGHANAVEHAGDFTDADRVLADHLRRLKDASSGTADAAPDLHALRNVITDLFAQVQLVKTGEWWPSGEPTGGVILPQTPAPHVAVDDADYWLLLSLRPSAVDYDEFRPALTPVPLVPQLQAAGADCGGSASVCAGGAERSNPTGQETPVAWSGQYPNGFLCRYCWW